MLKTIRRNLLLSTDGYKLTHWNQYMPGTTGVYSYLESREGARYPYTVFFGLQHILQEYMQGRVVTMGDVREAQGLSREYFGRDLFNYEGWKRIVEQHYGHLPLLIKAVPEGTRVPTSNVMMTIENTDPECYWLTNYMESLLTHVYFPSTVCTLSRECKVSFDKALRMTGWTPGEGYNVLNHMLHDFAYRGCATDETAAIGGAAHLVNFRGTDTLPAIPLAINSYEADPATLADSIPATEHSVMTARGPGGEMDVVRHILSQYPEGPLSIVGDSYDIHAFVNAIGSEFRLAVRTRDGVVVVRPDSVTPAEDTPPKLVLWILKTLWFQFGGMINPAGYKVFDPHVRIIWADGVSPDMCVQVLNFMIENGFAAENVVFGMGLELMVAIDRDQQRFAFKCSAQRTGNDPWVDVHKRPLDGRKKSKPGRLALVQRDGVLTTVREEDVTSQEQDVLQIVFQDGMLYNQTTFNEVRERAAL